MWIPGGAELRFYFVKKSNQQLWHKLPVDDVKLNIQTNATSKPMLPSIVNTPESSAVDVAFWMERQHDWQASMLWLVVCTHILFTEPGMLQNQSLPERNCIKVAPRFHLYFIFQKVVTWGSTGNPVVCPSVTRWIYCHMLHIPLHPAPYSHQDCLLVSTVCLIVYMSTLFCTVYKVGLLLFVCCLYALYL